MRAVTRRPSFLIFCWFPRGALLSVSTWLGCQKYKAHHFLYNCECFLMLKLISGALLRLSRTGCGRNPSVQVIPRKCHRLLFGVAVFSVTPTALHPEAVGINTTSIQLSTRWTSAVGRKGNQTKSWGGTCDGTERKHSLPHLQLSWEPTFAWLHGGCCWPWGFASVSRHYWTRLSGWQLTELY